MISFNTKDGLFDDERFSFLRKEESLRLTAIRDGHLAWARTQFIRLLPEMQPVQPEYVDYLGDFSGNKDPFNFNLNALYSEEV